VAIDVLPITEDQPQRPSVSIIIPCHNTGRYLREAIESARAQTYRPLEIIVVDDGSADDSRAIAESFPDVRVIPQSQQGVSSARNRGVAEARSGYLVFLDADDRLLPNALDVGVRALLAHPECALAYGFFRPIGREWPGYQQPDAEPHETDYAGLLTNSFEVWSGTSVMRRSVVTAVGGYRVGLHLAEDFELNLRMVRAFPFYCHATIVSEYRLHDSNTTNNLNRAKLLRRVAEVYKMQKPHIKGVSPLELAWRQGRRDACQLAGRNACHEVLYWLARGRVLSATRALWTIAVSYPAVLASVPGMGVRALRRRVIRPGARRRYSSLP
jgi:glycosyltransferase involved in cell wall biosynthesis